MSGLRTYFAINLKSYYASAECAAQGLGSLTSNLVVADASRSEKTICLAVSPSLKALGIPGRGVTVTVRYFQPDLLCQTDPPVGCCQTVAGTVQALDPVGKTLRLALDGTTGGPGVQKKKTLVISLGDIQALT